MRSDKLRPEVKSAVRAFAIAVTTASLACEVPAPAYNGTAPATPRAAPPRPEPVAVKQATPAMRQLIFLVTAAPPRQEGERCSPRPSSTCRFCQEEPKLCVTDVESAAYANALASMLESAGFGVV